MNVYVVRYENLDVFSTARKAIEAASKNGWGCAEVSAEKPFPLNNTSKAIALLNKQGIIIARENGETVEISRETVS